MKPTTYVVWRVGSNAANQSMTQRMPVGTIDSPKRITGNRAYNTALFLWQREHPTVTVYNNQHLALEPASRAPEWVWQTLAEDEYYEDQHRQALAREVAALEQGWVR